MVYVLTNIKSLKHVQILWALIIYSISSSTKEFNEVKQCPSSNRSSLSMLTVSLRLLKGLRAHCSWICFNIQTNNYHTAQKTGEGMLFKVPERQKHMMYKVWLEYHFNVFKGLPNVKTLNSQLQYSIMYHSLKYCRWVDCSLIFKLQLYHELVRPNTATQFCNSKLKMHSLTLWPSHPT